MARRGRLYNKKELVHPREILRSIIKKNDDETQVSWNEIFQEIVTNRGALLQANLLALLSMLATISLPMLLPFLVDELILDEPGFLIPALNYVLPARFEGIYGYIIFITLFSIVLRFIGLVLDIMQGRIFAMIAKDIIYGIRTRTLKYLQGVPVSEFETLGAGKIANHCTTDINTIDEFISAALSKFLIGAVSLIGVIFVMLWISPILTLFLILFNPMVAIFTHFLGQYIKKLKKEENQSVELFQNSLTETFESIRQIKVSNREKHFFSQLNIFSQDLRDTAAKFSWRNAAGEKMSIFVFMFGFDVFRSFAIVLVAGAIAGATLTIGQMFAMIGYLWFMLGSVSSILQIQYSFYSANGALERVNNLLAMPYEEPFEPVKNPFVDSVPVSLQVDNLSFAYKERDKVLDNVSFSIDAGKKVGIRGVSGCGKSTLVQVITGLYHKTEGNIYFNEVPVEKIGYSTVRENVATVMQHPSQLNSTLKFNLCLGKEFDDEYLWEVLKVAQLDDVVNDMPKKMDSMIGTRGVRMSGGQLQRLAIARALLTRPNMIILDEATSALDEATEERLHKSLRDYLPNITALIVAHRSSALNQADIVYEMKEGRLYDT